MNEPDSVWVASLLDEAFIGISKEKAEYEREARAHMWDGEGDMPPAEEFVPAARLAKAEAELARYRAMEAAMRDLVENFPSESPDSYGAIAGAEEVLAMLQKPKP